MPVEADLTRMTSELDGHFGLSDDETDSSAGAEDDDIMRLTREIDGRFDLSDDEDS